MFDNLLTSFILEYMENVYNDELLPNNFEEMAKAYSRSLKKKGFVFVRLEEEEFNLLVDEVLVLIAKMKASLVRLNKHLESKKLMDRLDSFELRLMEKFDKKKPHIFKCVENENQAFLSLVAIENMLILKLLSLSLKSGELELCNEIIVGISSVFAESFDIQGFALC